MGNDASKAGRGSVSGPAGLIQTTKGGAAVPLPPATGPQPTYIMKVVVRGARGTGKTCLLARLQGKPFAVEYTPTPEISMATINWTYKASDDKIRVELWDVVDTVLADETDLRQADDDDAPAGIGATASAFRGGAEKLDAEHVDVYKSAHAVVVMFDVTKRSSWDYVRSTLMEVPAKLPVLLLGNFRDMAARRAVSTEEIETFADNACRERVRHGDGRRVQAFECSLKDCFGLKVLYNYFNIPFLELKVAALQDLLKSSKEELATVREEVACYIESQDYESYTKWLDQTRTKRVAGGEPVASPGAVRTFVDLERRQASSPADDARGRAGTSNSGFLRGESPIEKRPKEAKVKKSKKDKSETKKPKKAKKLSDDSDDEVAGLGPRAPVPVAKASAAAPKPKTAKNLDEIELGGRDKLDAFLGDDDDVVDPRQTAKIAERKRIAQHARKAESSSESESDSSRSSSSVPPPKKAAPAKKAAVDVAQNKPVSAATPSLPSKSPSLQSDDSAFPVTSKTTMSKTAFDDFAPPPSSSRFLDDEDEDDERVSHKPMPAPVRKAVAIASKNSLDTVAVPAAVLDFAPPANSSLPSGFLDDDDDEAVAPAPPRVTNNAGTVSAKAPASVMMSPDFEPPTTASVPKGFLDDDDDEGGAPIAAPTAARLQPDDEVDDRFVVASTTPAPAVSKPNVSAAALAAIAAAAEAAKHVEVEPALEEEEDEGTFSLNAGADKKKPKKDKKKKAKKVKEVEED